MELFIKEQFPFILFELELFEKHLFELELLSEHLIGGLFGARTMTQIFVFQFPIIMLNFSLHSWNKRNVYELIIVDGKQKN